MTAPEILADVMRARGHRFVTLPDHPGATA